MAEQKGGSSNIVDLTRRGTWSAKMILKSEHLARKTNKSSKSFWKNFNFYKMLSNIIHILDIWVVSWYNSQIYSHKERSIEVCPAGYCGWESNDSRNMALHEIAKLYVIWRLLNLVLYKRFKDQKKKKQFRHLKGWMMPICLLLLELNNTNEVSNNYTKIRIVTLGFVISIR